MSPRNTFTALLALISLLLAGAALAETKTTASEANDVLSVDLAFINHLDANLIEQDIFVEKEPGSGQVYRITKGWNDMSAPLYGTAHKVPHDPFDMSKLGPYPKGIDLGMTVGQWLRHSGRGTYSCEGGTGTLDLSFENLVPNGLYTMWHVFIASPPTTPFSGALELPLGARDGSESSFSAEADGSAEFSHTFSPCLELSDVWTRSLLAIAFHSDGMTYQAYTGDYGLNTHVPLFVRLPPREGIR